MGKIIRPTYPVELSVGLLLLIFVLTFLLSGQIFAKPQQDLTGVESIYFGMLLVSCAVVIMLLVLWEEFLFPVKIKASEGAVVFRNHRNKLKKQLLIYCIIPVIFSFIYMKYELNHVRFFIWATVCIVAPVAGKLISGIKNYNDFLKLTDNAIEYKNNKKAGCYALNEIHSIKLIKDERNVLHKFQLLLTTNNEVIIDLDEMELEAFIVSIEKVIVSRYKNLLK